MSRPPLLDPPSPPDRCRDELDTARTSACATSVTIGICYGLFVTASVLVMAGTKIESRLLAPQTLLGPR